MRHGGKRKNAAMQIFFRYAATCRKRSVGRKEEAGMRILIGSVMALALAGSASAQGEHYVNGYYRSDGTYVAPHYQTNPNGTRDDNWSTRGNVNPYTGRPGSRPGDSGWAPYGRSSYPAPAIPETLPPGG